MNYSILVNKDNKIKSNYLDKVNFIKTTDIYGKETEIEEKCYEAYLELQKYLKDNNIEIGIEAAYRDFDYQDRVYEEYLKLYGKEYADSFVAPTGYSEHHTGLAIDIGIKVNGEFIDYNKMTEEETNIYLEIHKYLKDFGFILRYPKGKESITGYPYEPWHIRYVGKTLSKIITESNLTFEEYKKDFSGVIILNKEKGCTSFDLVNRISKIFGIKKVGHTGTLDPLAEGVLIVCIGKATKIVELLTAEDKEYIAGVKLGLKTDTYDIEGEIIEEKELKENYNLEEVLKSYQKTYLQEVPIYSAVKVNGKKLYEYARNNRKVSLPKKEVTIKEIELLKKDKDIFTFRVLVTKGCYIRSLINDIGNSLECGAIMTSLIRTKQGKVRIEDSYTIEDIENNNYKLYRIEEVLDYPQITIDKDLEFKIRNGMKIPNMWKIKDKVIIFNNDNKLLGIYELDNQKLRVWKNFN